MNQSLWSKGSQIYDNLSIESIHALQSFTSYNELRIAMTDRFNIGASGHAISIKRIEKDSVTGYQIFDPNFGFYDCVHGSTQENEIRCNKIFNHLISCYHWDGSSYSLFSISDILESVKNIGDNITKDDRISCLLSEYNLEIINDILDQVPDAEKKSILENAFMDASVNSVIANYTIDQFIGVEELAAKYKANFWTVYAIGCILKSNKIDFLSNAPKKILKDYIEKNVETEIMIFSDRFKDISFHDRFLENGKYSVNYINWNMSYESRFIELNKISDKKGLLKTLWSEKILQSMILHKHNLLMYAPQEQFDSAVKSFVDQYIRLQNSMGQIKISEKMSSTANNGDEPKVKAETYYSIIDCKDLDVREDSLKKLLGLQRKLPDISESLVILYNKGQKNLVISALESKPQLLTPSLRLYIDDQDLLDKIDHAIHHEIMLDSFFMP